MRQLPRTGDQCASDTLPKLSFQLSTKTESFMCMVRLASLVCGTAARGPQPGWCSSLHSASEHEASFCSIRPSLLRLSFAELLQAGSPPRIMHAASEEHEGICPQQQHRIWAQFNAAISPL